MRSRRALAVGVAITSSMAAAGVAWVGAGDGGCATVDRHQGSLAGWSAADGGCRTEDRRLGVIEGPNGWSAEARYQRWSDDERCHARVRVALFEPGGTWEDEALAPAGLLEAESDPARVPEGALVWEGDRIEVAGEVFDVSRLPRTDDRRPVRPM